MTGNESDPKYELDYAIRLTFGLVHSVILTLITFGLIVWFPSLSGWSFAGLGCLILPFISSLLSLLCTGCVQYVCDGQIDKTAIVKSAWIPPLGIFCVSLIILPLEMLPSGVGPLNALIATSVVMNALVTGVLQVYSFLPKAVEPIPKAEPKVSEPKVEPKVPEPKPKEEPKVERKAEPKEEPKEEPAPEDQSSTGTGSAISSPT